jgi:hypothetical protein
MPDYALTESEPEEPSHLKDLAIRAAQTSPQQEPAIYQSPLSGCLTGEIHIYVVISAALPEDASVSTVPREVSSRF